MISVMVLSPSVCSEQDISIQIALNCRDKETVLLPCPQGGEQDILKTDEL